MEEQVLEKKTPHHAIFFAMTFIAMFFCGLIAMYLYLLRMAMAAELLAPKTQPTIQTGGNYTNALYQFRFSYPPHIQIREAIKPSQRSSPNDYVLEGGVLQQVMFETKGNASSCKISVLPNPKALSLEDWLKSYRVNSISGNNAVTVTEETTLGGAPAKAFSVFLFDHDDKGIAALHKNAIYVIRYANIEEDKNVADKQEVKQIAKACREMIPTFKFL